MKHSPDLLFVCLCRLLFMAKSIAESFNITSDDTIYCALPLYHSAAGCLGVGQLIINGTNHGHEEEILRLQFLAGLHQVQCNSKFEKQEKYYFFPLDPQGHYLISQTSCKRLEEINTTTTNSRNPFHKAFRALSHITNQLQAS